KKQILKKAKNFRIKNTRELKEIQTELNKKFRPSKIYKSVSEAIRNLNNKITDSKLNNILNDRLDKLSETIKSVPDKIKHSIEKRKIKKENKEQERRNKEEERIFRETHKMDEFGNIYNIEDDKKWNKENNKLIKQQTASNKAKAEEERERKKLEDEANRLAEKNNISPNDFKQKKKKGLGI
ncbi:TPA: hypothetical protein PRX34_004415, partial [Escherichia coli]|nr:hypothetical protein [Salmonella enterica]EBR9555524.1 hypothetical protein [Salmonella enterica subsp. enterica serovar Liverpool]EGT3138656.1 hypothetical protein [Salmonella enterica subsp. enterica serovar Uganda]HDK0456260.1 hypothetical protein [Escherichia coli]EJO1127915.1 hypothetical protein [Salmonella enterica]